MPSPSSPRKSGTPAPSLSDFRFDGAPGPGGHTRKRGAPRFDLTAIDPKSRPFSTGDKARDMAAVDKLAIELDALQNMFYADRRFKLLVVLQGTDTSGKDGTVRGVFGRMTALGVQTVGWKAPTETERAHDFLWRIHQQLPARGMIQLFNRSHYEDVLVPVVGGDLDAKHAAARYAQINDFERMLTETGTTVLKFMLHISKTEQAVRLQDRLDDPTKYWKFAAGDLEARKQWDAYQHAYADLVAATGTRWAPWTIVPADSKTHRNLMVATVVRDALKALDLRYPPLDPALKGLTIV